VYDGDGHVKIPPFGCVFPTEKPGETINNPNGEMRAVVGNFIGSATNKQIAFAQGYGGNNVIRILQYNGNNDFETPRNNWDVVAQLYGTDVPELDIHSTFALSDEFSNARMQNANGGVSLAAGDIDGDGIDELVVGQTRSDTSVGTIQVLDLGAPNINFENVIFDAHYVEHQIDSSYRNTYVGNGGVNVAVADLQNDQFPEIIISSQGNSNTIGTPKSCIMLLKPIVENNQVSRIDIIHNGRITGPDLETSIALSIGVGEFSGRPSDGQELVIGAQSVIDYSNSEVSIVDKPAASIMKIIKPTLDHDGTVVTNTETIHTRIHSFYPAFVDDYEPLSHSVNVAGFHSAN
ncbi:FG-GAP repeat protein, partial [bacterium]|nr:FG-GAP repeat protein [bacterium]